MLQVEVPSAEPGSGFMALMESEAILWLLQASTAAVARRMRLTWDEVGGVKQRAVRRGLAVKARHVVHPEPSGWPAPRKLVQAESGTFGGFGGSRFMAKKRFTAEEIIGKLREAEVLSAQGQSIREICKRLAITDQTYYRWRKEYGGLKVDQARRLKDLEKENGRLKKVVAELTLDVAILKEAASGNF